MFVFVDLFFFFFKQKTAYGMRISDWSADVCSSDLERQRHRAVAAASVAGQVDDVQSISFAQALDQQREHPAVHRPAVQEHQRRAFARFLDAGIVVHAPRSVRNARARGRLPALRRPTRIANATIPSTTSTAPHPAMPRGHASCRHATPMAVTNSSSAPSIASAAPSATGLSRTLPGARKNRMVETPPAASATPAPDR